MIDWFSWITFSVSTVLALISFGFNLWQYYSYSKQIEGLHGSMSAWWHWTTAMRKSIETYWEESAKNCPPEKLSGIANATINGIDKQAGFLAEDIAKKTDWLGFKPPWDEPWKKGKIE